MNLTEEIIQIWADIFPTHGYAAGLSSCQGRIFLPTPENKQIALGHIKAAEQRRGEIGDPDLQTTAAKLLRCFRTDLELESYRPYRVVKTCAQAIRYILLKKEQQAPFIAEYLENLRQILKLEIKRWQDLSFPIEIRRLCIDAANYLRDTLTILCQGNTTLIQHDSLSDLISGYKALFTVPDIETDDTDTLLALLRRESSAPRQTVGYPLLLQDLYDFPETAEELREQALQWLDVEMPLVQALAEEIAQDLGLSAGADVGAVYKAMDQHYSVGSDVLSEAREMMEIANRYTADYILSIRPEDHIVMDATPPYLEALVTGGEQISLNSLTLEPVQFCYITPSKNKSRLTMLNILVHEYAHGFQASKTVHRASWPILKLDTPLHLPFMEAVAFHREYEFFEAAAGLLARDDLSPNERDFLALFGTDPLQRRQTVKAFELETRIWRVARFLRVLCDVEVNLGLRSYVGFIDWAHERTGLSREFIHDETFTFLADPGAAPCYAIAGMRYGELQREAVARGVSRREFNTRACEMGYFPRTVYEERLGNGGK